MTTYYKRCENAKKWVTFNTFGDEVTWRCECHGEGMDTLVPVAAGALLIPDSMDAAMERMIACDLDANGEASYEALLRAAVGEGDR